MKLLQPGDPGFDESRQAWNRAVDQQVAAVAEPVDAGEVAELVREAARTGLGIAPQAGGHGATARTQGAVLLRTRHLDGLAVDPAAQRAWIGAGVTVGRLQAEAAHHGLTGLPGSSPIVSVAGLALGGGLSWFSRKFGWVCDSVTALDIVDADGRQRRVGPDQDPDLYWALLGAGGDFAVVVALEVRLYPAPSLYGGRVWWAGEHGPEIVEAYRRLTAAAPDELSLWLSLAQFPGAPPMVALDVTYLGDEADARDLLAPLDRLPSPLSDSRRLMSPADVGSITDEPTNPGVRLTRTELLTALTVPAEPIAPLLTVQFRHLGGALAGPSGSPHGALAEPYAVTTLGVPAAGVTRDAILAKHRELAERLPVSGRKPVTFLAPDEAAAAAFAPQALACLRDLKHRYDPGNVFRANFPIAG